MGDKKIDVRGPLCFHSCLQCSDISWSLLLYTISAAIGFYIMHTQRKNSYFPNMPPTFACGVYQCSMFRSLPNNSSNILEIVSPSDGRHLLCIRAQAHYECLTAIQKCFASALPSQQKTFVPWPVVPRKGSWQLIPPKIMSAKIYASRIFSFIVPFLAREMRLHWCNVMVSQPWYSIVIRGETKLYKSYEDGWWLRGPVSPQRKVICASVYLAVVWHMGHISKFRYRICSLGSSVTHLRVQSFVWVCVLYVKRCVPANAMLWTLHMQYWKVLSSRYLPSYQQCCSVHRWQGGI